MLDKELGKLPVSKLVPTLTEESVVSAFHSSGMTPQESGQILGGIYAETELGKQESASSAENQLFGQHGFVVTDAGAKAIHASLNLASM